MPVVLLKRETFENTFVEDLHWRIQHLRTRHLSSRLVGKPKGPITISAFGKIFIWYRQLATISQY